MEWIIKGHIAFNNQWLIDHELLIHDAQIIDIDKSIKSKNNCPKLVLKDKMILPGFINSHDHLLGSWWPPLLERAPYTSIEDWLNFIAEPNNSPIITQRLQLLPHHLVLLGAYKQILSGVTTLINHEPLQGRYTASRWQNLPICLAQNVYNSWGIYETKADFEVWNSGIKNENKKARQSNGLHCLHLCEGSDEKINIELKKLKEMIELDERLLIVHANTLRQIEIEELAKCKVNICICPTSNINLFNTLPKIELMLNNNINILLGTDSWMSGSKSLFQEISNLEKFFPDLTYTDIFHMITRNPAQALGIKNEIGSINIKSNANIIVINDNIVNTPSQLLASLSAPKIEMVFVNGKSVLYSDQYSQNNFPNKPGIFSLIHINKKPIHIFGNPIHTFIQCCKRISQRGRILCPLPIDEIEDLCQD